MELGSAQPGEKAQQSLAEGRGSRQATQTLLILNDSEVQGGGGAERAGDGGAGHWAAAPQPPHARERVSCGRVIGSRDLPNDTVDYFTVIVSQGNLVMALHSHMHAQPRRAHGW